MSIRQKAFIVRIRPDSTHGLDELNVQLGRGWRVIETTPLGGAGIGSHEDAPELCLAALVIAERREEDDGVAARAVAQAEEETEEIVEEIVEGEQLSGQTLPEELEEERNGGS